MVLYADDINILVVDKDENMLTCKIENLMNHLEAWFNNNELILNIRKSCALTFHPRQREVVCKPSIFYNGVEISYKSVVKFLGINITESLNWHTHINSLSSSLSKVYFLIKTLKDTMSYHMIRSIYYAYFQSQLKYGIIFWGSVKDSLKVFIAQKKVMRLIAGVNKRVSCRGIFSEFKTLTLPSLYILEVLCFIKKLEGNLKCNFQMYNYNRKGKNKLFIQACNTALYQNSVINKAIRLYNKLLERIRTLKNFRCFKKEVKLLLISNTFYSIDEFLKSKLL
jgi:hypothetical protein